MSPLPPASPEDVPHIICTVDVVLLTLIGARLHVALLQRAQAPHAGEWALPGGYIHAQTDEDAAAAAARVLADKLGVHGVYLEQLATFSGARRDPRGWSLAVAHCALLPADAVPAQGRANPLRCPSTTPTSWPPRSPACAASRNTPRCPCTCAASASRCRSCRPCTRPCWASR
jgi:8-oxo-dGTP diphosphatase